jgi:hypothetical protein
MPAIADFRLLPFDFGTVTNCGRFIARRSYWRLYLTENLFRIIIHSVLLVQISPDWWRYAVDPTVQNKAYRYAQNYRRKSWFGKVGKHGIYYIDLKDLGEIMRANSNLFLPIIPDIDDWILGIETIRLPRNLVAHMNFIDSVDTIGIDAFYRKCKKLIPRVQARVVLTIPN